MKKPLFFDYNATTPVLPEVLEAMQLYLTEEFGNPISASHAYGWAAAEALEKAREQVAQLLHCDSDEILFTSGATESNNLALLGYIKNFTNEKPHIITTSVEHKAVLHVCSMAEKFFDAEVTPVAVDSHGQVQPEDIEKHIKPNTKLISVMLANNEVGTINPIKEIGRVARDHNIVFHTDAAQGAGKIPIDVKEMNIDLLSLSGHKIYAPKGVGALYVRKSDPAVSLHKIMGGGTQEKGLRPGTHNVSGIVGLGVACEQAEAKREKETQRLSDLRDKMINEILSKAPGTRLNGHPSQRLCNNMNFSFEGIDPSTFALELGEFALSAGSACNSSSSLPSHVLKAIGHSDRLALSTLRFGIGLFTTEEDIHFVCKKVIEMAKKYT